MGWLGDLPFFLVINGETSGQRVIDLNERQWMKIHADLMREPGEWILVRKAPDGSDGGIPMLAVLVHDGDQPYYTRLRVGVLQGPGAGNEVIIHGIGKKRLDGTVDRLWILPNGIVCAGDDAEEIGSRINKRLAGG